MTATPYLMTNVIRYCNLYGMYNFQFHTSEVIAKSGIVNFHSTVRLDNFADVLV